MLLEFVPELTGGFEVTREGQAVLHFLLGFAEGLFDLDELLVDQRLLLVEGAVFEDHWVRGGVRVPREWSLEAMVRS